MSDAYDPLLVTARQASQLADLLARDQQGRIGRMPLLVPEESRRRSPVLPLHTLMLLEPVHATRVGVCEILRMDLTSYILDVVILGWPTDYAQPFELRVDGVVKSVPMNATAAEFQAATGVTGEVSLGSRTSETVDGSVLLTPGRWRISWPSEESAEVLTATDMGSDWLVRIEQTLLVGTGNLGNVIQTIPTGFNTPLRAGAICEGVLSQGYYKLLGAEARFWHSFDTSGEY